MLQFAKKYGFILLTSLSLLVSLELGAGIVSAQQVVDSNFNPRVDRPAYTIAASKVLFDEAHLNFHTTQGRCKPFVDLISNDGYQVVREKRQ